MESSNTLIGDCLLLLGSGLVRTSNITDFPSALNRASRTLLNCAVADNSDTSHFRTSLPVPTSQIFGASTSDRLVSQSFPCFPRITVSTFRSSGLNATTDAQD